MVDKNLTGHNSFKISEEGYTGATVSGGMVTFINLNEGKVTSQVFMTEKDFRRFVQDYQNAQSEEN